MERRYLAQPSKGEAFHQHHQFQKGLLWNTKISFKRNFTAHVGHISAELGGVYGMVAFFRNKNRQKDDVSEWSRQMRKGVLGGGLCTWLPG